MNGWRDSSGLEIGLARMAGARTVPIRSALWPSIQCLFSGVLQWVLQWMCGGKEQERPGSQMRWVVPAFSPPHGVASASLCQCVPFQIHAYSVTRHLFVAQYCPSLLAGRSNHHEVALVSCHADEEATV